MSDTQTIYGVTFDSGTLETALHSRCCTAIRRAEHAWEVEGTSVEDAIATARREESMDERGFPPTHVCPCLRPAEHRGAEPDATGV